MKRFLSRREVLQDVAVGFGAMALNSMLQTERLFGAESGMPKSYDLTPKLPNFPARAKNVIFIYIGGGPSTIDMFDPKPALLKYDGKPAPFEIKGRALNGSQQIMASPWPFTKCGQSGREVSNLLPHFQKVVDKVTFVRSMTTDRIDHSTAQFTFVTGRGATGFPAIGSWVSYALGTENQNLPAYIALGEGSDHRRPRAFLGLAASHLQRHLNARRCAVADLRHQATREHVTRSAAAVAANGGGVEPSSEPGVSARSGTGIAHREL